MRYLYQPGELEGGKKQGMDPIWSVDIHKIDYNIVTQGIRVYSLFFERTSTKESFCQRRTAFCPG